MQSNLCCVLDTQIKCTSCDRVFCLECFEESDHTFNSGPLSKNFDHINYRWWRCIQSHRYVAAKDRLPSKPLILVPIDE